MPKKVDPAIKAQAKNMFVMQGETYGNIGKHLGVHHSTVAKWAKTEDWEGLRSLKNASSLSIELQAVKQINMIFHRAEKEDRPLNSGEMDGIAKLRKMIESLNRDMGFVTNGIEAIGLFLNYLKMEDADLFSQISEHAVGFTSEFAKQYTRRK